ncbi:rhodanese-like domain-containing protein [Membranihabitans marinus]|uniref:rhodanese-like domain-containing protein n=1 Tax=Membranihabitans marinus TaxID=1227546 RepID=UPI001F2660BA|nr:rhodanese-like domain-containing protein [Membranihabitans marinus]
MKKLGIYLSLSFTLLLGGLPFVYTQNPTSIRVSNPKYERKLNTLLSYKLPLISVESLRENQSEVIILDTRTQAEYEISHIEGAQWIGYKNFNPQILADLPPSTTIVTYCSVGYRSEKIGLKLKDMGFENVFNLYGSIFEWVNSGYPIVNHQGQSTYDIHTYNRSWSQWMTNPIFHKIY